MKLKISILVPTIGNRPNELIRLFNSIIAQDYNNLEVLLIVQDNFSDICNLCSNFADKLNIRLIQTEIKGLSRARNIGLEQVSGDIILLSDDDCWYNDGAFNKIYNYFVNNADTDILLTQIYDPVSEKMYKDYPTNSMKITNKINLLSKSSIEIAFRYKKPHIKFDELFGLGGKYIADEEIDFLIRAYNEGKIIYYEPMVTVFHRTKQLKENDGQIIAKGAFYAKNFGVIISNLVLIRDLLIKRENNYRRFLYGYFSYKRIHKRIN